MVRYISSWNKPAFLTAWQSPEGETDPEITLQPATHCLALSDLYSLRHTHINRHTCTNTTVRRGARQEKRPCLAGQLYGQAEISGCFPSSKLLVSVVTDRQSDSQTLPLTDSHAHAQTHNDWHRDRQTRPMDKETHSVGRDTKKNLLIRQTDFPNDYQQDYRFTLSQGQVLKEISSLVLEMTFFYFIDTCFAREFDLPAL